MKFKTLLTKSLLVVAGLCAGATSAWANDTFGALTGDDSSFGERSQTYTLAGYGTFNFTFTTTNAADGTDYHTWTLNVKNASDDSQYFSCWGTTYAYQGRHTINSNDGTGKITATSNYAIVNPSGSGIQYAMNGATVKMAVTRLSGNITVVSTVTPTNGDSEFTLAHSYNIGDATADNLHLTFSTECTTMDISESGKQHSTIDAATATSTAMKDYIKYEFIPNASAYAADFLSGGSWSKTAGSLGGTKEKGWLINTTGRYIIATFSKVLKAGDVVTVYAYPDNSTTADYGVTVGTGFNNDMNSDCNLILNFPRDYKDGNYWKQNTSTCYKLSYTVQEGDDLENRDKLYFSASIPSGKKYYAYITSINVTTDDGSEAATPYQLEGRKAWTFESMDAATYTSNQVIDNLYVGASSDYQSGIVADSRTVDGTAYTKALILNKHDLANINSKDNNSAQYAGCLFIKLPEGQGKVRLTYYNNGSAGNIAYCFSKYSNSQRSYSSIGTNASGEWEVSYSASDRRYLYLYLQGDYISQIYLYKIEVIPAVSATIGAYGYTTFSSSYPLDLAGMTASTGEVTAYYATAIGDDAVTLTSISEDVEPCEGLVLKGTAEATITIPYASTDGSAISNYLVGCPTEQSLSENSNYYVLVNNTTSAKAEFQSLATQGATIPAGKAYLNATGAGARQLSIVFEDASETTGIGASLTKNEEVKNGIYNLQGQRVAQPRKGLYIVGGKKVVVK